MVLPHQRQRQHGNDTLVTPVTPTTPSPSSQHASSSNNNLMVVAYEQPKISISRRLGYEIVTLVVGKDPATEPFAVHKNILRDVGGMFVKMCEESPNGSNVRMPEEDPEVIKLLIDYAYSDELPMVSVFSTEGERGVELRRLVQFYALLDKFDVNHEIRNKVMDNIQNGFYIVGKLPEGPLIQAIYDHSRSESKLRKFCAVSMVYLLHDPYYVQDGFIPSLINSNDDLMVDFLEAVRLYKQRQDPRIRHCQGDPRCVECDGSNHLVGKDGVPPCHFHIHEKYENSAGIFEDGPCYLWKNG
ncbi:hypothetical protein ONS95_008174 [Cadophora gregata]|uniref:uncharacterized protein n=1 Tax=Cadophora gregata TaxID=51156 RepID=UPI0026DD70F7|nr:uncharacterized protein ONS95_008174 [Cadophora gregata]KAK0119332.1 hypothetical protein ONS96_012385 [Cadophora gregata f. sp. sojae]KAK0126586.1 hypothetical protein ONS95_008174 [Cadophora gregata]